MPTCVTGYKPASHSSIQGALLLLLLLSYNHELVRHRGRMDGWMDEHGAIEREEEEEEEEEKKV